MVYRTVKSLKPLSEEEVTDLCIKQKWRLITIVYFDGMFLHYFEVDNPYGR